MFENCIKLYDDVEFVFSTKYCVYLLELIKFFLIVNYLKGNNTYESDDNRNL